MGNIDLCIWGCRDGFEVIYSENENWKSYILANETELDGKHQKVCTSLGEFYTLNKIDGYQVFSLIVPSIDIIPRQTYMVISLISKKEVTYGTQLLEVLNRIWEIYKRDNFSIGNANNQGQHLTYNNFNIQDFRSQIDSLIALSTNHFFQAGNCTILIDEINVFKNEFGRFKGNGVYFVNNNTEQNELKSALSRLPKELKILKEIVSKGPKLSEIDELKKLIAEKQNFDRANQLVQFLHTNLSPQELKEFTFWKNKISVEIDTKRLIGFTTKQFLTSEEKTFIQQHEKQKTAAYSNLNLNQIQILNQKLNSVDDIVDKVRKEIDSAERARWDKNPKECENIIASHPNLKSSLGLKHTKNLEYWSKIFNQKAIKEVENELTILCDLIKNASNKEKKKNLNDWEAKILELSSRIISLNDEGYTKKLMLGKRYLYLTSKSWLPKDRQPLFKKLILSIFILIVFTFGYFSINLDSDNDGIINLKDDESKTKWFDKENSKYNLKDYVTSNGLIDTAKTKKLCDCWKFPKIKERKILNCTNNLNWFVVDSKLYEYRKIESDKGMFYLDSTIIAKDSAGKIEEKHKKLFPINYPKVEKKKAVDPKVDPDPNQQFIRITYKGDTYEIKKGFTTSEGMDWNDSQFHLINNSWEKKSSTNGNWKKADESDINFILSKCAKKINSAALENNASNSNNTDKTTPNPKLKPARPPKDNAQSSGHTDIIDPADEYWLDFIDKTDEQIIQMKKNNQINLKATKPKSQNAKDAYNRVKNVN